ncbi:MAG: phosphatidylcholine/phosphatidylserine synthase [Mesorhizobium sp.]
MSEGEEANGETIGGRGAKRRVRKGPVITREKLRAIAEKYPVKKPPTWPQTRAFCVHILTASGSFLAFLSIVAASEERWTAMFWWLGLALLVDGIDGPIARKLQVKEVLPTWSGETLDNIIDYVTYVIIPAFALYQRGFMGEGLSFLSAAIIVVTSAIYYADTGMKTKENFFKGFPVVWNMVVFTLFVIEPGEWVAFGVVLICGILTFVPINFLHPVRVQRLRPVNLFMTFAWCGFGMLALAQAALAAFYQEIGVLGEHVDTFTKAGVIATSIYLFCIGAVLQFFPKLGAKPDKTGDKGAA